MHANFTYLDLTYPRLNGVRQLACLILLLGNFSRVIAQPTIPTFRSDTLTKRIHAILQKEKTPGVQVLVFTKDSLLYKLNAGVKNLKSKSPVTDESMFRLGSITKSFVAVSALMLIEKNQLALSDELKKLAPDIQFSNPWEATDPVRIVHLLEHTTGFDDFALKDYAVNDPTITLEQGLAISSESRHSRWRPGTFMAYCNSGPPIVARVIEKKTGQEFESFVRQHIFNPLGQKTITFRQDGAALTHLVTNYSGGNHPKEEAYWNVLERPAGSLNAPALELMPFVQMLLNRGTYKGTQLLQSTSIDRMELPTSTLAARAGLKEGYGLHNYTTAYKGYVFHGHDGGVNGGLAHYVYNTELNLGLIVLVNSDGAGFGKINDAVMEVVLKNVPQRLPPAYSLSTADKENLLGFYRVSNNRNEVTYGLEWLAGVSRIFEEDGRLFIKNLFGGDADILRPVSATQFMRQVKKDYTPQFVLTQNDEGQKVLVGNFSNTTKTSFLGTCLPIFLIGLALLMSVVGLVAGFIWLILYWAQKRKGQNVSAMPVRMTFWGYTIVLLTLFGTIATVTDPFELGKVNSVSVTVYVASILMAVFAIGAFVNLIRYQRQVPYRADRIYLWVSVCSALLLVGYMAIWGMIGIRLWA